MEKLLPRGVRRFIIRSLGGELHDHRVHVDYIRMVPALDPIPTGDMDFGRLLVQSIYEQRTQLKKRLTAAGLNNYQSTRVITVTEDIERCVRRDPKTVAQIRQMKEMELEQYFFKLDIERRFLNQAVGIAKSLIGSEPLNNDR